jgi:hypothetical protein
MIRLDLGLYDATVVSFHIISVVHLWLGGGGQGYDGQINDTAQANDVVVAPTCMVWGDSWM